MKINICVFEDKGYKNLYPLTYLRPTFELKCGIFSLLDKIKFHFGKRKYFLVARNILSKTLKEKFENVIENILPNEDLLFINGRMLINPELKKNILKLKPNEALFNNDFVIAAFIAKDNLAKINFDINGFLNFSSLKLSIQNIDLQLIKYPWNLVNNNAKEIINDFSIINKLDKSNKKNEFISLINKKEIYISSKAFISPFVTFDASEGPIYVDDNVKILSHTYLKGPIFIGKNSLVKANSSIYNGTTIGEFCKVGGEIEDSILHSFSNKQHDGFLGHSYLGQWINLGAGTNNSDLKNNYSKISVILNGEKVFTNSQFAGAIIGDHTKTAINTKINTGSIFGIGCNIFGNGFPPKYLPSFSWGGSEEIIKYDFDKFIETAKVVMLRRNVILSKAQVELLKQIYNETFNEKIKIDV